MYVGLNVGLSYISDCQLFGMHCQRSSSMLLLIIENFIGLSFSPIYIYIIIFFPLFHDQAKSVAMIRHSMDVYRKAGEIINPGLVSIITVYQPLYTIAKQIQWSWPDTYGENHFVVIFTGLHIEMTIFKVLSDLLEGRGWTAALVQADIAPTGGVSRLSLESVTCDSHQKCSPGHSLCSLYGILKNAYVAYTSELTGDTNILSFNDCCSSTAKTYPNSHF